ncbi:amidohydrolase family protein, partial [Sphingomonas bacterium]|uniref:amidohydrolase family protein n=1 Tax=Sphingomonas bacterium TaxID=1895847 RepID=UPI001574FEB7
NGAALAFGSGFPVGGANPFAGWATAISREDAAGQPPGGWHGDERLTREQAWRGYTGGAAYAAFAEKVYGRLAPGQRADFIIVDRDPLLATPAELRTTRVDETWVGGEKVFERK